MYKYLHTYFKFSSVLDLRHLFLAVLFPIFILLAPLKNSSCCYQITTSLANHGLAPAYNTVHVYYIWHEILWKTLHFTNRYRSAFQINCRLQRSLLLRDAGIGKPFKPRVLPFLIAKEIYSQAFGLFTIFCLLTIRWK